MREAESGTHWDWITWRYSKALHRFFAQRVSNQSDVGDLVQQVFVRVFQRSPGAPPIEHIQGYLFQVAASVLNDEHRRAKVRHQGAHEEYDECLHGPCCEISPERILLGQEAVERVAAAVQALPELTRDVYILRVHRECEYPEIARDLRISVRSAQRHMARALKALEDTLGGDGPMRGASAQGRTE